MKIDALYLTALIKLVQRRFEKLSIEVDVLNEGPMIPPPQTSRWFYCVESSVLPCEVSGRLVWLYRFRE